MLLITPRLVFYWTIRFWLIGYQPRYPDLEHAWRAGITALERNGIDPRRVPIFLVLGLPSQELEPSLMDSCGTEFAVRGVPEGPGPLHWYGTSDRIYLVCSEVGWLSRINRDVNMVQVARAAAGRRSGRRNCAAMKPNAWKPDAAAVRTRRWWLVHRALPVSVLVACLVAFTVLVAQPLFHPRVHLLFASAHYLDGRLTCSSPAEDLAALEVPPLTLLGKAKDKEIEAGDPCASPAALAAALDRADRSTVREGDVLIVWLAGEIVSRDGQLDFVCENFNPADLSSCCLPLAQVFDRVRGSSAATKLLVLDVGRVKHLSRLGTVAQTATQQIEQMVGQQRDTGLWVVLAHRELEKSHVLAGSRRSALAHFASEALQGAADANADHYVDVVEFYRYLREHVSGFVEEETRGDDAQTPRLLWGGGAWTALKTFPVLLPVKALAHSAASETAGGEEGKEGEAGAKESEAKEVESKEGASKDAEAKAAKDGEAKEAWRSRRRLRTLSPPPAALLAVRTSGSTIDGSAGLPESGAVLSNAPDAKGKSPGEAAAGAKPAAADAVLTAAPPELSAMAWTVHDRLAASRRLRPISTAPHLWRAFEDVLACHEMALQANDAARSPRLAVLTPELRRLVRQASDLAEGTHAAAAIGRATLCPTWPWPPRRRRATCPHSLAMARRLMYRGGPPLGRDVTQAVERLDHALTASDKAELQKFAKDLPAWADQWIEFRLARSLAARDDLSWDEIKLVLAARREAEAVAAGTLEAGTWTRLSIERGDALRHRGQQLVLQSVRPTDAATGATLLHEAIAEYEKAAAWNQDAIALEEDIDAALFNLPDQLRWSITALAAPEHGDAQGELLARLLSDLRQAIEIVDSPSQLPEVRRLRLRLEDTLAKLGQRANRSLGVPTGTTSTPELAQSSAERLGGPFSAGLAASDMRRRLLALATGVPPADAAKTNAPTTIEVRDPLHRLEPALENFREAISLLEGIRVARSEPPAKGVGTGEPRPSLEAQGRATLQQGTTEQDEYNVARQLGESTRATLRGLPQEIERLAAENQDLADPRGGRADCGSLRPLTECSTSSTRGTSIAWTVRTRRCLLRRAALRRAHLATTAIGGRGDCRPACRAARAAGDRGKLRSRRGRAPAATAGRRAVHRGSRYRCPGPRRFGREGRARRANHRGEPRSDTASHVAHRRLRSGCHRTFFSGKRRNDDL